TYCHLPIHGFSNVQDLEIELNKVCTELDPILPFNNLTKLKVSSVNSNWRLLLRFFNHCRNLRTLELNEEERDFVSNDWVEPEEVPYCIHSVLTNCTFDHFLGEIGEKECVMYLLKHAKALNSMAIRCSHGTKVEDLISCYKGAGCELRVIRRYN
ncbi:F-box/RNI/FBD-like domain protein, partial [Trifolium medium]|nr:F-box/RNI/FBD-like domain protein [Trifolium medium]